MDTIPIEDEKAKAARKRSAAMPEEKTAYEKSLTPEKIRELHAGKPVRRMFHVVEKIPVKRMKRQPYVIEAEDKIVDFVSKNPHKRMIEISHGTGLNDGLVRSRLLAMDGSRLKSRKVWSGRKFVYTFEVLTAKTCVS